jgi:hypothetical protein
VELADFELFTLAAAGVIPISPFGLPLKTPRCANALERLRAHIRKRGFGVHLQKQVVDKALDLFPKTWADVNTGQGMASIRSELLTDLKEAMFPVDQLPEHYRKAIVEREIETQQSKKADKADGGLKSAIKKMQPEVGTLYAMVKAEIPEGISNADSARVQKETFLQSGHDHRPAETHGDQKIDDTLNHVAKALEPKIRELWRFILDGINEPLKLLSVDDLRKQALDIVRDNPREWLPIKEEHLENQCLHNTSPDRAARTLRQNLLRGVLKSQGYSVQNSRKLWESLKATL